MDATWQPALRALDRAHAEGRQIEVWLRDDDCVAPTPALDRLAALCDGAGLPVLLAVIPASAEVSLAPWLAAHPGFSPCQHGWRHANHAPAGERARELGGRPPAAVLAELGRGRDRLRALFAGRLSDVIVPPWNRIDAALIPALPAAGYGALSGFAPTPENSPIPRLDSDLDIIDWRGGRVGRRPEDLARRVAEIVDRQHRLGILTHHLAHDGAAWEGLAAMVALLAAHPAARFAAAGRLLQGAS